MKTVDDAVHSLHAVHPAFDGDCRGFRCWGRPRAGSGKGGASRDLRREGIEFRALGQSDRYLLRWRLDLEVSDARGAAVELARKTDSVDVLDAVGAAICVDARGRKCCSGPAAADRGRGTRSGRRIKSRFAVDAGREAAAGRIVCWVRREGAAGKGDAGKSAFGRH